MAHLSREAKDREENIGDDELERRHFQRIINAFRFYRVYSIKRILLAEKHYNDIPARHKELIPTYRDHLRNLRVCVEHNYEIIKLIISHTEGMFENKRHSPNDDSITHPASDYDMDKVRSTIKQCVRDWSEEGATERNQCYGPVIKEIIERFPPEGCDTSEIRVLVPGAGLGRLAYEIAKQGYSCQGNEFSLFMLFASNFILNQCKEPNMFTFYPWAHNFSNNRATSDQTRSATFPDANPTDLPPKADFSMSAGDFLEVYTEPNKWNCVATVFFIDTAHNVISYIEAIWHILQPGGYWINLGPLLYHFADMANESSIELSYEELKAVIRKLNFEIVKEEQNVTASYTENLRSMLKVQYDCVYFVARKPLNSQCS